MKQGIAKLQKSAATGGRVVSERLVVERAEDAPATRARFSAGGLKKLRKRLGLTREAFAPLLGVSSQTIYIWESGQARPRQESVDKLAIVRGMTKQQAQDVLAQHAPPTKTAVKRGRKSAADKTTAAAPKKAAKKAAAESAKKFSRKSVASKARPKTATEAKKPTKSGSKIGKTAQLATAESAPAQ
ncbi:helix-turn-helix domain-containing protein [Lysobacter enzymogenes]|uniref:helix-turn-helix domain-containing protein n=1 Tax=Lysobacter enzymogenes TaxID=69 RepID=UPI0022656760|nr:helix-turn-helix transcriptional regulator [Lysobacter enzymogenes]UZW61808.1 helix-turn-helix transcriptional regulator [Lysobacter enzymogenes]